MLELPTALHRRRRQPGRTVAAATGRRRGTPASRGNLTQMDGDEIASDLAERVRTLIADAQEQAQQIVGKAEADAARIREGAEAEAAKRLDDVRAALSDLQGKLGGEAGAEVTPGPVTVPEPAPPDVPEPTPDPVPDPVPGPERVPEPSPEPVPEPEPPA